MIVHLSILIMNPSEKTTSKTSNATTSDNTTDQVPTQVIDNAEFDAVNDFRMYNSHKTMIDNPIEYNVTESGWAVSVLLSQPYNASLILPFFYTTEITEVGSDPVNTVFSAVA